MKYICIKPYSGKILSGDIVEIDEGAEFETIGPFIAHNNEAICRAESEMAKDYFKPVEEAITPLKMKAKSPTAASLSSKPAAGIRIIEIGECPFIPNSTSYTTATVDSDTTFKMYLENISNTLDSIIAGGDGHGGNGNYEIS